MFTETALLWDRLYTPKRNNQRSKPLIALCVIDKLVVADKLIVVDVQSKRQNVKNTIWFNITTLICQNKFIYEI